MANTITAANSVLQLVIAGLYAAPQQIQGFAQDEMFDLEAVASAEVLSGVDGNLSAGWVFTPVKQSIVLQADSLSNLLFDAWYAAQEAIQEVYYAQGVIHLPAISRSYVLTKGILTSHKPGPEAKKVLQPRKYEITWQSIIAAPVA